MFRFSDRSFTGFQKNSGTIVAFFLKQEQITRGFQLAEQSEEYRNETEIRNHKGFSKFSTISSEKVENLETSETVDGENSGKLRVNVEIFSFDFVRTHVRKRKIVVAGFCL